MRPGRYRVGREEGFRFVKEVVGGIEGRGDTLDAEKVHNARRIVAVNSHPVLTRCTTTSERSSPRRSTTHTPTLLRLQDPEMLPTGRSLCCRHRTSMQPRPPR
eukprot:885831-Rhodomonas_salina.1